MHAVRRYVPSVATVVVVALCVVAGNWQRARMHYKESLRAQYDSAAAAAPLDARALPIVSGDWAALRYRQVALQGTFERQHQFFLDNKVQAGLVGYDVIAPLRLDDGRVVLVDRGWVAQGPTRAELPAVATPAGPLLVRGRIEQPAAAYFELQKEQSPRPVWQHLDLSRFSAFSGIAVLPVIVQQTVPVSPEDRLTRSWPAPDFGIDTHRIYMVQWYTFAVIALTFWGVAHWPRRTQPRQDDRNE
ncbi:MAG: SURF1 family protein [Pseudomonadota bacterium]|nr:SURF1 family protein [Pseudomonadota bacterium]